MRKMKLAMLIVFCVMLFGGTVVSFVLPDREFSDVENRELAKKPKITAKRILSGEYQKEYDTYLSDQFFFRDKWVDLAVREQIALGKKDFNGVYLGKNNYLLEKYEKADFDSGQIKENETYLTTFLNETEKRYGREACEGNVCSIENDSAYKCFAGLRRHDRLAVYDSGFADKS